MTMEMRSHNDDLQREVRQQHELADELLRRLNLAKARLDIASKNAEEARDRFLDAKTALEEQVCCTPLSRNWFEFDQCLATARRSKAATTATDLRDRSTDAKSYSGSHHHAHKCVSLLREVMANFYTRLPEGSAQRM